MTDSRFAYVVSEKGVEEALGSLRGEQLLALDTETTGLHTYEGARPRLLQLAAESSLVYVFDLFRVGDGGLNLIREFFQPQVRRAFIIHNAAFDIPMLWAAGLLPRGADPDRREDMVWDTMIASQLLLAGHPHNRMKGTHSLAGLAKRLLNIELEKTQQASDWGAPELSMEQIEYAAKDVEILFPLRSVLRENLKKVGMVPIHKVECQAAIAFGLMSQTGIPADKEALEELKARKEEEAQAALHTLAEYVDSHGYSVPRNPDGSFNLRAKAEGRGKEKLPAGWNPRSTPQMMQAFRETGTPIPIDRLEKKETLDQKYLAELRPEYPLVDLYLRYKEAATRISNVETLLKHYNERTGRIHSSYRQLGADSGRTSSNGPNVQQIPRSADFRGCFKAGPGHKFIVCDYSQIELRLAAAVAREEKMLLAYRNGEDIHKLTGSLISGQPLDAVTKEMRSRAKCLNFALLYGCGARALREQAIASYGVDMSLEEAETYRKLFFDSYGGLRKWHERIDNDIERTRNASKQEMVVLRTPFGRRRLVLRKDDRKTIRANTPIQGLGADIIKTAMALLAPSFIENQAELVAMVHDEIVLRVREEDAEEWAHQLSQIMQGAGEAVLGQCEGLSDVDVVAEAGVCDSWAEK